MTNYEFEAEYGKLISCNEQYYSKKIIKTLIAECVAELDKAWFNRLITRIILNPTQRIDIADAARTERLARKNSTDTRALIHAFEEIKHRSTDEGLKKVLANYGANSLIEAIKNYKAAKPSGGKQ